MNETTTILSQVRKSANDEIDQIESRIHSRSSPSRKLTRRQSIQQSLEFGSSMGGNLMSKSPIIDNRCRSEEGENLMSPIPHNGKPPILIQTKQQIQSMVNTRIKHHRKAQMLIEKAEDALEARVGATKQSPSKLLKRINQAIQPLESKSAQKRRQNQAQFATPSNLNHPMAYQTDLDSASMNNKSKRVQYRLNGIEKSVQELEEYSVSTPELRAALQIITVSTNVRAKKVERQLQLYKEECMTKEEAMALFQSKKNNAKFVERAMEIATNQVRTVIGSEVKSILKNEWHDMTKGVDQIGGNGTDASSGGGGGQITINGHN